MNDKIHDDKCYHCGQTLTAEARKHLEKIGGLLAKTPEQLKAEEEAETKKIKDLAKQMAEEDRAEIKREAEKEANQKYEAKMKAEAKTPEQLKAEEEAFDETIANAKNSGIIEGQKLSEE